MQADHHSTTANIGKALTPLLGEEPLLPCLAAVLEKCCRQGAVRFKEIRAAAGTDAMELLLLAWDWRLLIPRRSSQCAEWDDRVMRFEPDEIYDIVNIVQHLVTSAARTGAWNVDQAAAELYARMGAAQYRKMPVLIRELTKLSENGLISAANIHRACTNAGLSNQTGTMIAILKGGGVISPKLMSRSPAERKGCPVYEVHPALTP